MNWSFSYDLRFWPSMIVAVLTIILSWYSWRQRDVQGAKPFSATCLFAFLWAVGATLEMSATGFSSRVFWIKFQAVWQLPTMTALFCFVLAYAGFGRWLTRRNLSLLAILPLMTLLLVITNRYHHLIWTGFGLNDHVIQTFGSANWICVAYASILGLVNIAILLWLAVRSSPHRWPSLVILLGMTVGLSFYLLGDIQAGYQNKGERIVYVLGSLSLACAVALFRLRVFDPVPAARAMAIEQTLDGMLVLDLQARIVDSNPAAQKALKKSAKELHRTPIAEVLSAIPSPDKTGPARSEISLGSGDAVKHFNLTLTYLNDRRGQVLGQLLLFHDVTEQKQAQTQIVEQQRVVATLEERDRLARELHDSIGQVLGYVNLQAQTIQKWIKSGDTGKANTLLTRLAEVAQGAHSDVRESILSLRTGTAERWAFFPALKQYLVGFQAYHGIQTELDILNGLEDNNFKPETGVQLLRVIQEGLTNARKHSRAHSVKVIFDRVDTAARITIADDGCGFDPGSPVMEGDNHFGLVFMRERMSQIGGALRIDSHPGEGTTVHLDVPLDKEREAAE